MITITSHARTRFAERIDSKELESVIGVVDNLSGLVDYFGGKCRIRINNVVLVINDYKVVTVYTNKSRMETIRTWVNGFKCKR